MMKPVPFALSVLCIVVISACSSANVAPTPTISVNTSTQVATVTTPSGVLQTATGTVGPTRTPLNDACAWLSRADVQDALGMPLLQRSLIPSGSSGTIECSYDAQGHTDINVMLIVYHGDIQNKFAQSQIADPAAQKVDSIGDEAAMLNNVLYFRSGTTYFSIAVTGQPGKEATIAEKLAPKVINNMKTIGSISAH